MYWCKIWTILIDLDKKNECIGASSITESLLLKIAKLN